MSGSQEPNVLLNQSSPWVIDGVSGSGKRFTFHCTDDGETCLAQAQRQSSKPRKKVDGG
jgi:hypothetical protein